MCLRVGQEELSGKCNLAVSTRQPDLPDFTKDGSLLPEVQARRLSNVRTGLGGDSYFSGVLEICLGWARAPLRTWSWVTSDLGRRLIYRASDRELVDSGSKAGAAAARRGALLQVPTAELAGGGFGHFQVSGDDRQTVALLCH